MTIPGGSVTGNNKVWKKFSFSPITTTKIRVLSSASSDNYSRLTEVEAWTGPSPPPRYNLALASIGAVATASNSYNAGYGPGGANNGDRKSLNWTNGGGWNDSGPPFPDWLQIDFGSVKTINEVDVFTLQDNWGNSAEPTEAMTFTQWGLTAYAVEYWSGSSWIQIPNASVTGNNKIWRKFEFSPISTSKIRVVTSASVDGYSRLTEVEAYGPADTGVSGNGVHWLVPDHLGTPRIVLDQTGNLAGVKRHDYLPFGGELFAGTGGRTAAMGYSADSVRQQFTQKERDVETALDYFGARYYAGTQGRFTGADAFFKDSAVADPQSWNKYAYARNNPLKYVDPEGEKATVTIVTDEKKKTGTITINATIAVYAMDGSQLDSKAVDKAAHTIESSIEKAWSGTYVQDGITYTVTTNVDVSVVANEAQGEKSGAQNVIGLWNGPVAHNADSLVFSGKIFGGPDAGQWNINTLNVGATAAHEFAHLLGVDDRKEGKYLSNTYRSTRLGYDIQTATAYDYGWALGGAIKNHIAQSKSYIIGPNNLETRGSPPSPRLGSARDHKSTHELRAGRLWWN